MHQYVNNKFNKLLFVLKSIMTMKSVKLSVVQFFRYFVSVPRRTSGDQWRVRNVRMCAAIALRQRGCAHIAHIARVAHICRMPHAFSILVQLLHIDYMQFSALTFGLSAHLHYFSTVELVRGRELLRGSASLC